MAYLEGQPFGHTLSHLHFHKLLEISIVTGESGVYCIWNKVCRLFKSRFSMTPNQYRKEMQAESAENKSIRTEAAEQEQSDKMQ